jgi:hypothetical protein
MEMHRPLTLMGVSWSWKMVVDTKMVAVSLKMPATDLPAWMSENKDEAVCLQCND